MHTNNKERLIQLYQQTSELTKPECASVCRVPHSCCSPEYCGMAEEWAKKEWGIDLSDKKDTSRRIPFLSEQGCVVAPHLRPLCTLHTCAISGMGFKKGDEKWTEKYFELREEIDCLEFSNFDQNESELK